MSPIPNADLSPETLTKICAKQRHEDMLHGREWREAYVQRHKAHIADDFNLLSPAMQRDIINYEKMLLEDENRHLKERICELERQVKK